MAAQPFTQGGTFTVRLRCSPLSLCYILLKLSRKRVNGCGTMCSHRGMSGSGGWGQGSF